MNKLSEELPLINLNAPKVKSRMKRAGKTPTEESIKQDQEDATKIMSLAGLDGEVNLDDKIEPEEKYLIETTPDKAKYDHSINFLILFWLRKLLVLVVCWPLHYHQKKVVSWLYLPKPKQLLC